MLCCFSSVSASFASSSAISFPSMPTWLGIQDSVIDLFFEWSSWIKSLIFSILGSGVSRAWSAMRQDRESVYMTNLVSSDFLMRLSAVSMAMVSAVKMDASFGRRMLISSRLCTIGIAAAPTARSDLDPSV